MTTMRSARTTLLSFLTTVSGGHSSRIVGGGCGGGGGGVFGGFISSPLKTTTTTRSGRSATNTARTTGWFQQTKLFGTTASGGGGTGDSYGFCNIKPMFKVTDWDKMKPIMAEFVEKTRSEKGCVYYGWVKSGDDLICREAYKDGQAILDHLDNVGDLLSRALDDVKCASLESLAIMGPAEELDVVKPATADFGTEYYAVAGKGGFTNMKYLTVEEEDTPYLLCCIEPLFTVNDWDKAKPLMDEFEDAARTEPGCLFYGWVANDNNKLICREAYVDGAATVAHIDNVGALLGEGLEGDSPALTLESINLQLPSDQLSTVKPVFDDFGTVYYEAVSGFGRYNKV